MLEREDKTILSRWIDVDDAYLGGQRRGGKVGRAATGKTPFIAAVSTTQNGHLQAMKFTVLNGFFKESIA